MNKIKLSLVRLGIVGLSFLPFIIAPSVYAQSGRTVSVCSSGCNYTHINDAIENALDNDVIYLNTAEFDGMGVISRSNSWQKKLPTGVRNLTIKGKGQDRTIWKSSRYFGGNGNMLHIDNLRDVRITIKDLTFRYNSNDADFVKVYDSNDGIVVNFDKVNIMGSRKNGIVISGRTQSNIKSSYFEGNLNSAISVHNNSTLSVVKSEFKGNYNALATAYDSSRLEFMSNEVYENSEKYKNDNAIDRGGDALINFNGNSTGSVNFNEFSENYNNIIHADGNTDSKYIWIENNEFSENKNFSDIVIRGNKLSSITRNKFSDELNGSSVMTIGGSREVYVMNNIISNSGASGIIVNGSDSRARFFVVGNTIYKSLNGILLQNRSSLLIRNNIISENRQSGIARTNSGANIHSGAIDSNFNLVFASNQNYLNLSKGANDINSDPIFKSTTSFRLNSNSPAVNAGDPNLNIHGTSFNADLNGTRSDIGVYGSLYPYGSGKKVRIEANDDSVQVRMGNIVTINPLDNDKGIGNIIYYLDPTNSVTAKVNADSSVTILANRGFLGEFKLKYKINDAFGSSDYAYITVRVVN